MGVVGLEVALYEAAYVLDDARLVRADLGEEGGVEADGRLVAAALGCGRFCGGGIAVASAQLLALFL